MDRTKLVRRYLEADLACADFSFRLRGTRTHEKELLIPSPESRQDIEARQNDIRTSLASLDAPGPVFSLLKTHFTDFLNAETLHIDNYFTKPESSIGSLSWKMEYYAAIDSRPDEQKADVILSQLHAIPSLVAQIQRMPATQKLSDELAYTIDNYQHYAKNAAAYFPTLPASRLNELTRAIKKACEAMDFSPAPSEQSRESSQCIPFTEQYYRDLLSGSLGVELDDLLSWHETELAHTREEVKEIASRLPIADPPKTMREVSETLTRYAGPCDSPDEMFRRAHEYVARTREAAREFVWFPEEVCQIEKVPYPLRESYPWGGYADGDGLERPIRGRVFLNDRNYRAVTDGWIKILAIHEAYPGHHLQYVRNVTDTLPETLKLGVKHVPLIEGVAHRSERLFEFVFEEDPFYPLTVAFRRHHTAVRVKSDLMLRYWGRPIDDAVRLYMDEMGFDPVTARGQVRAQEQMEGYFTCYYYGMKRLAELEAQYGTDKKSFTETLFSCGNISLQTLEGYLRLSAEQRKSYRADFRSLFTHSFQESCFAQ